MEEITPASNHTEQFPHLLSTNDSDVLNPKLLYRDRFPSFMPGQQTSIEVLSSLLLVDENTVSIAFNELCCGDAQTVDENLFTTLWLFLSSPRLTESEIAFLRRLSASPCTRCKKLSQSVVFLDASRTKLLSLCAHCRGADAFAETPPLCFSRAVFGESVPLGLLYQWHSITFRASAALKIGYTCLFSGDKLFFPERPISELSKLLKAGFQRVEKYEYVVMKTRENWLQFYCSQRNHHAAKRRKRMRETKRLHQCGGSFTVSLSAARCVLIKVAHEMHHEEVAPKLELNTEDINFIKSKALEGLAPFQICGMLQKRNDRIFSWSQVYYRWCELTKQRFMRSQDPFASCKILLETSKNLSECYFNEAPYALGFITDIGQRLVLSHECAEAFIDSTYKTNSSKLELFAVLTTVFGTGFPIAYLFLQGSADGYEAHVSRQSIITEFLHSIQAKLPVFKPKFFFTDKDQGQMNAIRTVFKIHPSLCLWHMKRAIKFKIRDLRKSTAESMTEDDEKKVLDLTTKHYNMHPYVCVERSVDEIREIAVADFNYLLSEVKTQAFHGYLMKHWYDSQKFKTWGRRNEKDGIPFTRTTMMVEAHWAVLKRHYLILHNRPRVDFITHLIDSSLMLKFENDYKLLSSGLKKPFWWKDFAREWRILSNRPSSQIYFTDNLSWKCSCPAFLMSRFLICKHLISGSDIPCYRDVVRSKHPPFLIFLREENRHFADLEPAVQCIGAEGSNPPSTGLQSNLLLPSSIGSSFQVINTTDNAAFVKNELEWLIRHVDELEKTQSGARQIAHIKNEVLQRLSTYRTNVEKELSSRGTPITWGNVDTLYLP